MSDKLELAAATVLVTANDLLKPWIAISEALARIATGFLEDFAEGEDSKLMQAIEGLGQDKSSMRGLADTVLKLIQADKAERAAKLCKRVLEETA
jgi:hypothetical protein